MKKLLLLSLLVFSIGCKSSSSPFVTLYAQSFPLNKTVLWEQADLLTALVSDFTVQMDSGTLAHINPSTCLQTAPFTCQAPVVFPNGGQHTITIIAHNVIGSSSPFALSVNVIVPVRPANVRIQ